MVKHSNNNAYNGFTIVELLVVIIVIGILAAITVVAYTGITSKAKTSTIQTDLTNASKKLQMYLAEYGNYPATMDYNSTNGQYCPSAPSDTNYCIKPSSDNTFSYIRTANQDFSLVGTIDSGDSYQITAKTPLTVADTNWITIGTQTWAKANLNVGTRINASTAQTNNAITEKYCYNNLESNCTTYGALYTWYEIMQYTSSEGAQGLCPSNSHIPTDNNWKELEMALSMSQTEADKLYTFRGTNQAYQMRTGGTSGLNLTFAGAYNAGFGNVDNWGYYWSSTEDGSLNARNRIISVSNGKVSRSMNGKDNAFTVRCLKN